MFCVKVGFRDGVVLSSVENLAKAKSLNTGQPAQFAQADLS